MSIILCDLFVFILMLYLKTIILQKNRQSFCFILIILFEVLSNSSSANKSNVNWNFYHNCYLKLSFMLLSQKTPCRFVTSRNLAFSSLTFSFDTILSLCHGLQRTLNTFLYLWDAANSWDFIEVLTFETPTIILTFVVRVKDPNTGCFFSIMSTYSVGCLVSFSRGLCFFPAEFWMFKTFRRAENDRVERTFVKVLYCWQVECLPFHLTETL